MDITPNARRVLEEHAQHAASRSGLRADARTEARIELESHLYDLAADAAREDAADEIRREHALSAVRDLGSPDEVDAAFFAAHRALADRAEWAPRILAYLIDAVILAIVVGMLTAPLMWLAMPWGFGDGGFHCEMHMGGWDCHGGDTATGIPIPWFLAPFAALAGVLTWAIYVGYFAVFEKLRGQTPGKMVLRLEAVTTEGTPLEWSDAILRNLTKLNWVLVFLDFLLGWLAYRDDEQRLSDRFVETMVVRVED